MLTLDVIKQSPIKNTSNRKTVRFVGRLKEKSNQYLFSVDKHHYIKSKITH